MMILMIMTAAIERLPPKFHHTHCSLRSLLLVLLVATMMTLEMMLIIMRTDRLALRSLLVKRVMLQKYGKEEDGGNKHNPEFKAIPISGLAMTMVLKFQTLDLDRYINNICLQHKESRKKVVSMINQRFWHYTPQA